MRLVLIGANSDFQHIFNGESRSGGIKVDAAVFNLIENSGIRCMQDAKHGIENGREIMMDLQEMAFELAKHLDSEGIIEIDNQEGLKNRTCEDIVLLLREKLQETYPKTKLKRMMKSVHFANGFQDEGLKRIAFILTDEIEQYLTINKFLDHDTSVEFFNNKITSPGFVINPIALVAVELESLLISKGRR